MGHTRGSGNQVVSEAWTSVIGKEWEHKMAKIIEGVEEVKPVVVKEDPTSRPKHTVKLGDSLAKVLEWDKAGEELYFEHDLEKFMALSESDVARLSRDNRVRYSVSKHLNANEHPEGDPVLRRIQVVGANARRKQFEEVVKGTSQSARATKKLQAFVGEGYNAYWSRTDKIEDRLARGYEIVKPGEDIYAGVSATDGHFETRVKQGETELVLMRVSKEKAEELKKAQQVAAQRFDKAGEQSGASELRAMGATLVGEQQGGNWQDRA
jgi:hypothetical protein